MSFRIFKSSSASLFTYDNILLKLFIDISNSGDFKKLIVSGNASEDECLGAWEEIIKKNGKVTGTNQYNAVLQLLKGYALLLNDHKNIRAALIFCKQAPLDWEVLTFLKSKGYEIDTVDDVKRMEDVRNGLRRNENLITKATMKNKELQRMFINRTEKKEDQHSFVQCIGRLNFYLGWNACDDNITLALFNQYQKELNERNKEIKNSRDNNNFKRNG